MNQSSKPSPRVALTLVTAPGTRHVVSAPPALIVHTHAVDYTCGNCGTVLMHTDLDQVHNLLIRCTNCGSYNSMDE